MLFVYVQVVAELFVGVVDVDVWAVGVHAVDGLIDGSAVDVLVVCGLFVGEMVACVLVEDGQFADAQAEYELVEYSLVETVCEKFVYRWVGCERVVSWCAVCVFVDWFGSCVALWIQDNLGSMGNAG